VTSSGDTTRRTDADAAKEDRIKAAVQTYIYGYPMVYNLAEIGKVLDGTNGLVENAGPNRFAPARRLLGPDAKFVTPNNDTLYLIAGCDLSVGPLVLDVPDTHDRYYGLQFVDAWSNNFAYVGRRATGTRAGRYLLTPPGYSGPTPDGMSIIEAPSAIFVIVGRIQVNGDDDTPAVHALQDAFALRPLDPDVNPVGTGLPTPDARVKPDVSWWEQFRVALAAFPPPADDRPFLDTAASLGLTGPGASLVDIDADLAEILSEGRQQAEATLESLSKTVVQIVDGWSSAMHAFDYNLDHCGPGTIDTPEWKIADRTTAYVTRAVAARLGLWGNHGYEARYDILWEDENGDDLDGAHSYELTLSPAPPVDAFWSLTMYDEPDYYLVANPIDRYSIGDRTPGLQVGADGSVTIVMQKESPGTAKESNWLPAPSGKFRPVLRSYQPTGSMVTGEYVLPKVRKTS
jgi:hypothetical protein